MVEMLSLDCDCSFSSVGSCVSAASLKAATPLALPDQPQGEAVSFTRDGLAVPDPYPGEIDWLCEQIADQHDFADEAAERAEYFADQRRDERMMREIEG